MIYTILHILVNVYFKLVIYVYIQVSQSIRGKLNKTDTHT